MDMQRELEPPKGTERFEFMLWPIEVDRLFIADYLGTDDKNLQIERVFNFPGIYKIGIEKVSHFLMILKRNAY